MVRVPRGVLSSSSSSQSVWSRPLRRRSCSAARRWLRRAYGSAPGIAGDWTGLGGSSGTWSLAGYTVNYLAVKAGNNFVIYKLAAPGSSGTWSTVDLGNKDISHLEFFGSVAAVPEPASWAMLIAGLGIVGAAMRRRKTAVSFA